MFDANQSDQLFYVVTVNYHSGKYLEPLVESLAPVASLQGLVIVDHSGELSVPGVHTHFPITIVNQPNKGYGAGLNRGLQEIPAGEALALECNPDIRLLTPEAVGSVLDYMKAHPHIGALAPRMITPEQTNISSCRQFYNLCTVLTVRLDWIVKRRPKFLVEHYYWNKGFDLPFIADWCSGAALFLRMSMFPDRNPFDERFFLYFEDVDFCAGLWKQGWVVEYFPRVVMEHAQALRSHTDVCFLWRHIASLMRFVRKHKGFPTRDSLKSGAPCYSSSTAVSDLRQEHAFSAMSNRAL